MANAKPSYASKITKVEAPEPSLLDRIAEYLGYEKKPLIPRDANLWPDDLMPKPRDKPKVEQLYKNLKRESGSPQDSTMKASVSTTTKTAKPSEEIPIAELPKASEVDVQDPRRTPLREPTKASPEQGVEDFLDIPALQKIVEGSLQKGPPLMSSLSDRIPERTNIDIAEEFLEKHKDMIMDANRLDLGPAMALVDGWMKGKTNLAGNYRPPTSYDDMYKSMMQLNQAGVNERDDAELNQRKIMLDGYDKIILRPRNNLVEALSRVYQGTDRDIASVLRNLNSEMQSGENVFSNNKTRLQEDVLRTRTDREMAVRAFKAKADLLNTRINSELGRRGGKDKADYYKNIDRILATIIAPKFTPRGTTLPEDRKEWSSKNSKTLGSIINFSDFIIASRGYDINKGDIDELMRLRSTVLNEIALGFNRGEWTDPEIKQLADEYYGKSGD